MTEDSFHLKLMLRNFEECRYLGVIVDNNGVGENKVKHQVEKQLRLDSVWWDKSFLKLTKKRLENMIVHGCVMNQR